MLAAVAVVSVAAVAVNVVLAAVRHVFVVVATNASVVSPVALAAAAGAFLALVPAVSGCVAGSVPLALGGFRLVASDTVVHVFVIAVVVAVAAAAVVASAECLPPIRPPHVFPLFVSVCLAWFAAAVALGHAVPVVRVVDPGLCARVLYCATW